MSKRTGQYLKCQHCGKEMYVPRWEKNRRKFCSKKCFYITRVGTISPMFGKKHTEASLVKIKEAGFKKGHIPHNYKGGRIVSNNGYVKIVAREHPRAYNGYMLEHIIVMEKHLGRYLNGKEIVHHINEDTQDNRIENLMLFENNAKHMKFHRQKYKEVEFLHEPKILNEVVCKIDVGGQSRKYQVRQCSVCSNLFWTPFYGKTNRCRKSHKEFYKKNPSKQIVVIKKIHKICKLCKKEFLAKSEKTIFCNKGCYHKDQSVNSQNYNSYKVGHKPSRFWLGKKRSEETKKKISDTKRGINGYNK